MAQRINKEIKENIIRDYLDGISAEECARKYNVGATSVRRYLKANNIDTKLYDQRKYKYNENYFEVIDCEEKAYWLGFIAADGSITKNSTILEISLKASDVQHLEKFVQTINGTNEMIKYRKVKSGDGKEHDAVRLMVCSPKLCNDLAQYYIVPRKGFILDFPTFLSQELIPHYIRGYFDGDGSVGTAGLAPSGAQKYNISIIATESFLLDLMDFLEPLGISNVSLEQRRCNMSVWKKGGIPQIKIFLDYIYKNSQVYLQRKYERYLEICRPETKTTEVSGGLEWN
jgi:DNA-binding transcriptional regulator WhiA